MSTNMTLIETKTAGSGGVSNFDFTSIPATYTDLYILCSLRSSISANADDIYIQFNNSSSNFSWKNLYGNGSTVISQNNTNNQIGTIPAASMTASSFGNASIYITNYASANYKSVSGDSVAENNATRGDQAFYATLWSNTAAITSVKLLPSSGTFLEFSTASLYGISNVTSTTKATGGIVSSDGTYNYHMFPYSGTFTPTQNITADYLVIAGGGGGGRENYQSGCGGGGGAGGLRSTVGATGGGGSLESALSLTANTAYTVTVGAGGAAAASSAASGSQGGNSVFSTITSTGGGAGGGGSSAPSSGGSGGSGGGAANASSGSAGGAASPSGQGYAGGLGNNAGGAGGAGGGGGAGAVGSAAGAAVGGNGGAGVQITAFANATQTGVSNGYYAGGGGGAGNTTGSSGGIGGGGNGTNYSSNTGTAGIVNTGGGGGGGSNTSGGIAAQAGGSGLVIIRYAI